MSSKPELPNRAITNEEFASIRAGTIPMTHALCFMLGWQGGTVHQVAATLKVTTSEILQADELQTGDLCRKAQAVYWDSHKGDINMLIFKHFKICVEALKRDYDGHETPPWLERASGVLKIISESVSS